MKKDKKELMLEKLRKAQKKSEELHKKWDSETSDEDKRWSRMIADISICLGELMHNKEISQRALAEKMGVKESAISRLLGNDHNPTLKTLAKLESAIGEILVLTPRSALRYLFTGSVEIPQGQSTTPFYPIEVPSTHHSFWYHSGIEKNITTYDIIDIDCTVVSESMAINSKVKIGNWKPSYLS